jgi:HK97 family phage prohead protease
MESLRAQVPLIVHKSAAPAAVVFEGYASVFNTLIDAHVPTIIERGAFKSSLSEQWDRIKILWQHNSEEPIGRPLELREDERGLFLRAQLSATARGQEAAQLLRDGVLTEMSVGFDPIHFYMDQSGREPVRHITELRLWEISLVTFAANAEAKITQVHQRAVSVDEQLAALDRMVAAHDQRQVRRHEAQVHELHVALINSIERSLR